MKGKLTWSIFWALIGISVLTAIVLLVPVLRELIMGSLFIIISGTALFLLGLALIFFTIKEKVGGILKKFLILTGASSIGFFVSILWHNAIYGLFTHFFGADFWHRIGLWDEPFFFIIAVFLCPIGFLVGAVGSIFLASRQRRIAEQEDIK